jgi:hypothetical protein
MRDHKFDQIPSHVMAVIHRKTLPAIKEWILAERIDPELILRISAQPCENQRDWVLKVHMEGGMRVFPIKFPVVH